MARALDLCRQFVYRVALESCNIHIILLSTEKNEKTGEGVKRKKP